MKNIFRYFCLRFNYLCSDVTDANKKVKSHLLRCILLSFRLKSCGIKVTRRFSSVDYGLRVNKNNNNNSSNVIKKLTLTEPTLKICSNNFVAFSSASNRLFLCPTFNKFPNFSIVFSFPASSFGLVSIDFTSVFYRQTFFFNSVFKYVTYFKIKWESVSSPMQVKIKR